MRKRNWFNVVIIFGIASLVVIGLPLLVLPFKHKLQSANGIWIWLICVQEILTVGIAFLVNKYYVRQPVFYRFSASIRSLIFVASPVLIVFFIDILSIGLVSNLSSKLWGELIMTLISTTLIGISEEYLFRGLIFPQVLKASGTWTHKDLYAAISVSSLLFACIHVLNLSNQDLTATVIQMINAFSIGCLFCALYIRSGSLLLPIIFHSLWDFNVIELDGIFLAPSSIFGTIIFNVVVLAITAYDLRNWQLSKQDNWIEKLVAVKG